MLCTLVAGQGKCFHSLVGVNKTVGQLLLHLLNIIIKLSKYIKNKKKAVKNKKPNRPAFNKHCPNSIAPPLLNHSLNFAVPSHRP
jgi:hypothetical protein